jgi:hypothetical protein
MTPQTVCLRADPNRVRVAVRHVSRGDVSFWRVSFWSYAEGKWIKCVENQHADPVCAVERAMDRALRTHGLAVTFEGAEFPHPQRRAP